MSIIRSLIVDSKINILRSEIIFSYKNGDTCSIEDTRRFILMDYHKAFWEIKQFNSGEKVLSLPAH